MTYVAIAFSTIGDAPSKGAYINELLALRVDQHGHEVDRLHLYLGDGTGTSDRPTLEASFKALDEFIGAEPVVIHDGYDWKRFLRHGLKGQTPERVKALLMLTVDVSDWSQRTYPRQRKDLVSLLNRLGLRLDAGASGLEHDVLALVKIAPFILQVPLLQIETPMIAPVFQNDTNLTITAKPRLPFGKRVVLAWSVLLGMRDGIKVQSDDD